MDTDSEKRRVEIAGFSQLFRVLKDEGYQLIGPTVRDQAIVYSELHSIDDLPRGWGDEQEAGVYRIKRRDDDAFFGHNAGPHSWKNFLFPSREKIWSARRRDGETDPIEMTLEQPSARKMAFVGVRSCDLRAIEIQDRIFIRDKYPDELYQRRRENSFIIAMNCTTASKTCFCVSMSTGPKVSGRFDLAFTEVLEAGEHYFLFEAGSEKGREVLAQLPQSRAKGEEIRAGEELIQGAVLSMGRVMDTHEIKELLYRNFENPRWDEVAKRCLNCTNCTLVCPTCFCSTVEDVNNLSGDLTERWRRWDSCFTLDHSYMHGGNIRSSGKSRYRQWLTHKVASWIDQFQSSGCVGCGRCIAWCPVGIDITQEVAAIRATDGAK